MCLLTHVSQIFDSVVQIATQSNCFLVSDILEPFHYAVCVCLCVFISIYIFLVDTDSSSHDMLDNNTFVITDTSCTESDTETAQCLPIRRTAYEMISRKLRQRYSHIGKGLRMHEKERRLVRKYMKSETDRNISEIKLNKVKLKIALLKKQKLQLQMLMVQRRLNLQNR